MLVISLLLVEFLVVNLGIATGLVINVAIDVAADIFYCVGVSLVMEKAFEKQKWTRFLFSSHKWCELMMFQKTQVTWGLCFGNIFLSP